MLEELVDRTAIVDAAIVARISTGVARFDDRLCRTPDGWRFTRRTITNVWSEGNPAVVAS